MKQIKSALNLVWSETQAGAGRAGQPCGRDDGHLLGQKYSPHEVRVVDLGGTCPAHSDPGRRGSLTVSFNSSQSNGQSCLGELGSVYLVTYVSEDLRT